MGGELRLKAVLILSVFLVLSASVFLRVLADGSLLLSIKDGNGEAFGRSKMVVGSRPPGCMNKCSSCRPCVATLVVAGRKNFAVVWPRGREEDEDGYYLLSWRCRCGDKIFQP